MWWTSLNFAATLHGMDEERSKHWKTFGKWLETQLVLARLTQTEMAARAKISDTQLRHYLRGWKTERGQVVLPNPTELTLHALADALDIDPREVCQRAGRGCTLPVIGEDEAAALALDDDEEGTHWAAFSGKLARLSPERRRLIERMVDEMLGPDRDNDVPF